MALKLVSAPTQPWFRTFSGRWAALHSAPPGRFPSRAPRHLPAPVPLDDAIRPPRVLLERAAVHPCRRTPRASRCRGCGPCEARAAWRDRPRTPVPSCPPMHAASPSLGTTGGPSAVGRTAPVRSLGAPITSFLSGRRGLPVHRSADGAASSVGLRDLKTVLFVLEQLEQTWYTDSQREGDVGESA